MSKLWPSPIVFVAAMFLFVKGCTTQDDARRYLAEHPIAVIGGVGSLPATGIPTAEITRARQDIDTGHVMQIAGGVLAAIGVVLLGVSLFHRQAQTQALSSRLGVTYEFVSAVPAEGVVPDPGLLAEDQAVEQLQTRYPTLARTAADKLRREFAEKRRLEPTKIWYVKDLQVREVS